MRNHNRIIAGLGKESVTSLESLRYSSGVFMWILKSFQHILALCWGSFCTVFPCLLPLQFVIICNCCTALQSMQLRGRHLLLINCAERGWEQGQRVEGGGDSGQWLGICMCHVVVLRLCHCIIYDCFVAACAVAFFSHMPHMASCKVEWSVRRLTSAATVRGRTLKSTAASSGTRHFDWYPQSTLSASGQLELARSCTNSIIKPFNLYVQRATSTKGSIVIRD